MLVYNNILSISLKVFNFYLKQDGVFGSQNLAESSVQARFVNTFIINYTFQIMEKSSRSKGGRPAKNPNLSERIRLRVSKEDVRIMQESAQKVNLTLPEYIRENMLKGGVSNIFSKEEQQHKMQLIGMSNNLNQLIKEAHTYGLVSMEKKVTEMLTDICAILERYHIKAR